MIETPFNYTGNKFKLLNQILPLFDYSKSHFIDVFTGGGSVYTNVLDKYETVVANDIIDNLIGIHNSLLQNDEIIERTKNLCPGKNNPSGYSDLRNSYNESPTPDKLWALMLSCTNNMMRFNQKFKFNQTYGDRGWNSNTDKKVEEYKNHIRKYVDKIRFVSTTFDEIDIFGDNNMVYLDPPYGRIKNSEGLLGKKQISEAGYNCYWKEDDDFNLYHYIKSINNRRSSFMVSGVLKHNGETCWMLDKLIRDGFNYKVLEFDYNKVSRVGDKKTVEVIITNYDFPNG
jgi:DNA adenine methylase Dam